MQESREKVEFILVNRNRKVAVGVDVGELMGVTGRKQGRRREDN
jgi:hypothetical protein